MRGPRAWFPWLMIFVSLTIIPSMFSAIPGFLATLLASLYRVDATHAGLQLNTLASLSLVGCAVLALRSSYRMLEKSQTVVTLVFLVFILAAFVAFRPDTWALVTGAFSISLPGVSGLGQSGLPGDCRENAVGRGHDLRRDRWRQQHRLHRVLELLAQQAVGLGEPGNRRGRRGGTRARALAGRRRAREGLVAGAAH